MGRAAVGLTSGTDDRALQAVAAPALDLVEDGHMVGLGSCHAAATFITRLGERVLVGYPDGRVGELRPLGP